MDGVEEEDYDDEKYLLVQLNHIYTGMALNLRI
jgi:hypothetical protein